MKFQVPDKDGAVNEYDLSHSTVKVPRIYYVNGIRVVGREHAVTAALLSLLTEHPIWGIYNKTSGLWSGLVFDTLQCVLDYAQNATARLSSHRNLNRKPIPDKDVGRILEKTMRNSIIWNTATARLVQQLVENRGKEQRIIAHSQGNLITSNALFVVEDMLGASALKKIRVYSLASPAPAWPLGLRRTNNGGGRQENAFMNDMIALLRPHNLAAKVGIEEYQNEGDFRTDNDSWKVSLGPHNTQKNIALNFLHSIRDDLNLPRNMDPEFLRKSAEKADSLFTRGQTWWQWLDDRL